MKILYEDNHLLVVVKPINVPVCEDESKDMDCLTLLKTYLKEKYNKPGNVYLGLVHRLDRPVGGVMVFAKTSKAASRLSDAVRKNELRKTYLAVVEGKPEAYKHLEDYLIKDEKTNTVRVCSPNQGKLASLDYTLIAGNNHCSLVQVDLHTGRSHQIRVQMAHDGHALLGDQRYNKHAVAHQQIALFAYRLSFAHPITKEIITYSALPDYGAFTQFDLKGL